MNGIVERAYSAQMSAVGDGRTIRGLLAPYGEVTEVNDGFGDYWETIDPGAFTRVLRGRPQYLRVHLEHPGRWVGRGEAWRDSQEGLAAELRLDDTESGREAAFKVRDGQLPGLSLAFMPGASQTIRHDDGRDVVHRQRIKAVHHVALCPLGAYSEALVHSLRSAPPGAPERHDRVEYWQQWTERIRRV